MFNYNFRNNPRPYQNESLYSNSNMYYCQENLPANILEYVPEYTQNNQVMHYSIDVPINLAKSLEGKYFLGYAEFLRFGEGTNTWARLYNPVDSGINLHVAVWTVSDISESTFTAQIWFNSTPPGTPLKSEQVTPSNTALYPLSQPKIILQYASGIKGMPTGGIRAFVRRGQPGTTLVDDEQGKFIFPPGGSFTIFLSNPQTPTKPASGSIAFGWWEEPIV